MEYFLFLFSTNNPLKWITPTELLIICFIYHCLISLLAFIKLFKTSGITHGLFSLNFLINFLKWFPPTRLLIICFIYISLDFISSFFFLIYSRHLEEFMNCFLCIFLFPSTNTFKWIPPTELFIYCFIYLLFGFIKIFLVYSQYQEQFKDYFLFYLYFLFSSTNPLQ